MGGAGAVHGGRLTYRAQAAPLVYRSTSIGVDAIDPSTGQSRWSWATGIQDRSDAPVRVLVDGDALFFLGVLVHTGRRLRALVCLDAQQGTLRWVANLEPLYPGAQQQIALIACGPTLVISGAAPFPNTVGIARADGRQLWARQEPYPQIPVLSVDGKSETLDRTLLGA